MSPKRVDLPGGTADTVIGAGVKVKGNLHSDGDIVVDGSMSGGDIKAAGSVALGVNAVVKANITARNVSVAGQLKGNIEAEDSTTVLPTAKVVGSIKTINLSVALGAIVIGNVSMPAAHVDVDEEMNGKDEKPR